MPGCTTRSSIEELRLEADKLQMRDPEQGMLMHQLLDSMNMTERLEVAEEAVKDLKADLHEAQEVAERLKKSLRAMEKHVRKNTPKDETLLDLIADARDSIA